MKTRFNASLSHVKQVMSIERCLIDMTTLFHVHFRYSSSLSHHTTRPDHGNDAKRWPDHAYCLDLSYQRTLLSISQYESRHPFDP